ncbi:heterokaryon incompatibility protein-domain-containing protein [Lasiosphaeria ovina]|uniref:Heterokaryon incompatibility protein-domain-containing protein n=1 Tax=Lasiosphaeria ovina TaxID=92902 RepID=A0AAE0NCH3_9PEZI|nr:heterokaryon incompatibility protein-domain-containing protein [Lasiosphaeria ovina]
MDSAYEYGVLGAGEFRVLRLIRAEQGDDDLKCRLDRVRLSDRPPASYYALSYVWGSGAASESIKVVGDNNNNNNKTVKITETLSKCLKRYRLADADLVLWVDQICINQQDLDERSAQVQIMGDIYRNAASVLAWLGEDPGGSCLALAQFLGDMHLGANGEPDIDCFVRNHLPEAKSPKWEALDALLGLPYFSRVWVMQEVILGRKVSFRWGADLGFDLTQLRALVSAADRAGTSELFFSSVGTVGIHRAMVLTNPPQERRFEDVMIRVAHRHASNPRDRIFAVLGFVDDRPGIVPRYDTPVRAVFTDAAMQVIAQRKNLDILSYVSYPVSHAPDPAKWPTWVPAWDYPISPFIVKSGASTTDLDRFAMPCLDAENHSLGVRGRPFGRIEFLGMTPAGRSDFAQATRNYTAEKIWEAWKFASAFEPTRKRYGPFFLDMFLSSILGGWAEDDRDKLASDHSVNDKIFRDFAAFWADVLARTVRWIQDDPGDPVPFVKERIVLAELLAVRFKDKHIPQDNNNNNNSAPPPVDDWRSELANDAQCAEIRTELLGKMEQKFDGPAADFVSRELSYFYHDADWVRVSEIWDHAGSTHAIFALSDGRLGIGPLIMEKTDVVVALNGGRVPFVLRPTDGGYVFLGACYTAGCIHENLVVSQEEEMFQLR